jgi:hypothetical protein
MAFRLTYSEEELRQREGLPGAARCALDLQKIDSEFDPTTLGLSEDELKIYRENPHIRQVFIGKKPVIFREKFEASDRFFDSLESVPKTSYNRRQSEAKTALHSGQRKLLLVEIEFLQNESREGDTILYAGAAPGYHLPELIAKFPGRNWILVDPQFISVRPSANVAIYTRYLDVAFAQTLSFDLFLSDIRREAVENKVCEDMDLQKNIHLKCKPRASLLKFRLPYTPGSTEYLRGRIFFQPFAGRTSAETRLLVKGGEMKRYDHKMYEDALFHFNTVTRTTIYGRGPGCKCYDCSAERFILS